MHFPIEKCIFAAKEDLREALRDHELESHRGEQQRREEVRAVLPGVDREEERKEADGRDGEDDQDLGDKIFYRGTAPAHADALQQRWVEKAKT